MDSIREHDAPHAPGVARLLADAREAQWRLGDGIDWDVAPAPPRFVAAATFARMVALLHAGEEATAAACDGLTAEAAPGSDVRAFLEIQAADERRHAAAYRRYLLRLGVDAPPPQGFACALAALADWRGPPAGRLVAVHILLEGEALRLQRGTLARLRCPLFGAINRRVARDEARHVAFGKQTLPALLGALDANEKAAVVAAIRALWREAVAGLAADRGLARHLARSFAAERWDHHARVLEQMGLPAY
jgi:hypothetical protein